MTANRKMLLLLGGLACANLALAFWGARDILAGLYDPILRSVGA